ncbi:MAG: Mn-containing catalase, partial [Rubrobacteraceae bacterium]|nr:Mn-containing catalase [Rubrobacteraceae bacterium]
HARKYMDRGFHRILYRFSPDDYRQIGEIWIDQQADTGEPREVLDGPPEGGEVPDLTPAPPLYAPRWTQPRGRPQPRAFQLPHRRLPKPADAVHKRGAV